MATLLKPTTSIASNLERDKGRELLEQLRDYLHASRRFKYEPPEKYNPFDEQPEAMPRGDRV